MQPSSSFSEPNVKSTAVKPQGVEEDNVSLKWKVLYLVKKENNVSDDVTHSKNKIKRITYLGSKDEI